MAWFRRMGADEVAYHQATVVGRADDHPGQALDYYGSRGETPLRWGGAGAARLGLSGEVTPEAYEAAFGEGGFRDPRTGTRLVASKRPGFELVVSTHKSVAMLGVIDQADAMHSMLDVETGATMAWLDDWFQTRGGRRGREQVRTATGGLTYAVTRHATSRAGDPSPHDHVLVANLVEMLDQPSGFKALDSAALRDTVEAATMVGRLHSAWAAVEAGYTIVRDDGPSGHLRHWRIVGIPDEVTGLFSKRSDEIAAHLEATGESGYRARGIAARATRSVKRHTGTDELLPGWHAELEDAGWTVERPTAHLAAAQAARRLPLPLTADEIDQLAAVVLDVDGELLTRHKVFTRTRLVTEVAPLLYGRDPAELDRVLSRIVASEGIVPLIGVAGVREQSYTTVEVLAAEQTIATVIEALADQPGPTVTNHTVADAVAAKETAIGALLTDGQRGLVEALCRPEGAVTVVIGVAGSGKTTAIDAAASALATAGHTVLGTSTSGQAARTLGHEAHVEARTLASLLWRLDGGQVRLDDRSVVVVDEAGMVDDADLARLALAVERSRAKLVLVGDHRQLAAVGPGGALAALMGRRPDLTVTLDENVRQADPAERHALANLRDGSVPEAVAWYATNDRVRTGTNRIDTLAAMAAAWSADVAAGHDTALLAWRRADVTDLNRLARDQWDRLGRLYGDDVQVTSGRVFAVGERVVALKPNHQVGIVTSEQLTIDAVTADRIEARTVTGRPVVLTGEAIDSGHLDYAYALTVHRAQGATYRDAHVLAAGGGRELAYVALSRAKQRTTIYATADDLAEAVDDLQADWGVERHQRWITDTAAQIGHQPPPTLATETEPVVEHQPAEQEPVTLEQRRDVAHRRLATLEADYRALHSGTGRWTDTPQAAAVYRLDDARSRLAAARRIFTDPNTRRRDRRAATKATDALAVAVETAELRWRHVGQPHVDQLAQEIGEARREIDRLRSEELIRQLDRLQRPTMTPELDYGPEL